MAKRITGCDWASAVIEGIDVKINAWPEKGGKLIADELDEGTMNKHKSALRIRSERIRANAEPCTSRYGHLADAAFRQYADFDRNPDGIPNSVEKCERVAPRPKVVVVDHAWELDLPRFSAAPVAHLSSDPFENQGAFPAQC